MTTAAPRSVRPPLRVVPTEYPHRETPRETPIPPALIEEFARIVTRKLAAARNLADVKRAVDASFAAHARLNLRPTRASLIEIAAGAFHAQIDAEINRRLAGSR